MMSPLQISIKLNVYVRICWQWRKLENEKDQSVSCSLTYIQLVPRKDISQKSEFLLSTKTADTNWFYYRIGLKKISEKL